MDGYEIDLSTTEIRLFESPRLAVPFEVEVHRNTNVVQSLLRGLGQPATEHELEPRHILRLVARIALTGQMLPPLSVLGSPGVSVPLTEHDILRLGLALSKLEKFPTEKEYEKGSPYLELRSVVENILEVSHTDLVIRGGKAREQEEFEIKSLSSALAEYQLPYSMSPDLSFSSFVDLLSKNKKVFAFPQSANYLLGSSAIAAAYQIAIVGNPIVAIQLAGAGAVAYVVIKFGAAIGKRIDRIFES